MGKKPQTPTQLSNFCRQAIPGNMRYRALWSIEWLGYFGPSGSGCHFTVQEGEHFIARERQLRERTIESPAPRAVMSAGGSMLAPNTLYIGDNGRITCGKHCGCTAQATGADLHGSQMLAIDAAAAAEWLATEGEPISCETCSLTFTA